MADQAEATAQAVNSLTQAAEGSELHTTPAAPSAPAPTNAANTGITAPPADLAREAFERLARGESPDAVNKELYHGQKGGTTAKTNPPATPDQASQTEPAGKPASPAPQSGEGQPQLEPAKWPEGMDAKDLNVLRRAQMDPDTWAAIPPSNRAKILTNLKASQAAADREFQQRRQQAGTQPEGTPPPAPAAASAPTEGKDEATRTGEEDDALRQPPAAKPKAGDPPAAEKSPAGATGLPAVTDSVDQFLTQQDLETLQLIGGDELAETHRAVIGRVVQHYQQQTQGILGVAEFLLNQHVEAQFDAGLDEIVQQPGLENLRAPEREKEREALQSKAMLLFRAAGDPKGYPMGEAVKDAAASLFKINLHQATQARLLSQRDKSLRQSAEPAEGRRTGGRPLSDGDRNRAIYELLSQGYKPEDARRAVDGS